MDARLKDMAAKAGAAAKLAAEASALADTISMDLADVVRDRSRLGPAGEPVVAAAQSSTCSTGDLGDSWKMAGVERAGRGLRRDLRRKLSKGRYLSDIRDGFRTTPLTAIPFTYLAMLVPVLSFGRVLRLITGGVFDVPEALASAALSGAFYALVSGQPLTLLGPSMPVIVFIQVLRCLDWTRHDSTGSGMTRLGWIRYGA